MFRGFFHYTLFRCPAFPYAIVHACIYESVPKIAGQFTAKNVYRCKEIIISYKI